MFFFSLLFRFRSYLEAPSQKYDVVVDGLNVALGTEIYIKSNAERGERVGIDRRTNKLLLLLSLKVLFSAPPPSPSSWRSFQR